MAADIAGLVRLPVGTWTGAECRALRQALGLTQDDAAKRLGYTRQGLQNVESRDQPIERVTELALRWLANELAPEQAAPDPLVRWHERAQQRFSELAKDRSLSRPPLSGSQQFSYVIHSPSGKEIPAHDLADTLRKADGALRDLVLTSTGLFYVFVNNPAITPYFAGDPMAGVGNREFLESAIFPDTSKTGSTEFWRYSAGGMGTHLRPLWEDRPAMQEVGLQPGTWFWPYFLVRSLAELTRHARAMAESFTDANAVSFRCEWIGLKGRVVADPNRMVHWEEDKKAKSNWKLTTGQWAVSELDDWPTIVSALGGPVMRMFDTTFEFSPEWVAQQGIRFRQFG